MLKHQDESLKPVGCFLQHMLLTENGNGSVDSVTVIEVIASTWNPQISELDYLDP